MGIKSFFKAFGIEVFVLLFLGWMAADGDAHVKTENAGGWGSARMEKPIDQTNTGVLHLTFKIDDANRGNTAIQKGGSIESPKGVGTDSKAETGREKDKPPPTTRPESSKHFVPSKKIEPDQAVDFPYDI